MNPLFLALSFQPSVIIAIGIGAILVTMGVRMRRASLLSLGFFLFLCPIFAGAFAIRALGEASEEGSPLILDISIVSSSAVIILIAFLITRRF